MTAYLLDTHTLIWWNAEQARLGAGAKAILSDAEAEIFASSVNAFEIATKYRLGKLDMVAELLDDYRETLKETGFRELSIETHHALLAGRLDYPHRDPFDRLLIAQALAEGLVLISNEQRFDSTGVSRLWD